MEVCKACDMLLVVGSSLMVWSAYRLAVAAKEAGAKLVIVNVGTTRADALADLKVRHLKAAEAGAVQGMVVVWRGEMCWGGQGK